MCLLLGMRRHQGKLEEWWALPEGQWGCGVPTTDSMTPRQWEGGAWHREPPPLCSMPGDARASCLPAGHRVVQERTPASLGPGTHAVQWGRRDTWSVLARGVGCRRLGTDRAGGGHRLRREGIFREEACEPGGY